MTKEGSDCSRETRSFAGGTPALPKLFAPPIFTEISPVLVVNIVPFPPMTALRAVSLALRCSINEFVSSIKVAADNQTQISAGNQEAKRWWLERSASCPNAQRPLADRNCP